MTLREALDRTLLLMRDEFGDDASDAMLLAALTGTRVALIADDKNIASHSAQTAFVTAAMLMARSGHKVFLLAPDVEMIGRQPPLRPGRMIDQLLRTGADLLPGIEFAIDPLAGEIDLAIALGNSPVPIQARRCIRLNATSWAGQIQREADFTSWNAGDWPLGAMASAGLASAEAFKIAMGKLHQYARNPARLSTVFSATDELSFVLAPPETPCIANLGQFDCVSGGAIINAILYALLRIPGLTGAGRLIEPDVADLTNLNRYMLLTRSQLHIPKARDLTAICTPSLRLEPIEKRYEPGILKSLGSFAPSVLVGVDDIPTRWAVQQANPAWLGIGATTHWSAMASFHRKGLGCAQCLHAYDDPGNAPIPTVAFVSFWSGLLTAAYFLRHIAGQQIPVREQQVYMTPFRAENPVRTPAPIRENCPTCDIIAQLRAA